MKGIILLLIVLVVVGVQSATPFNATVKVANGWINGKSDGRGHKMWLGVPYATAPLGNLRWKRPQPMTNWATTLDATNFRAPCIQSPAASSMSEDCLFLNVYAPESWQPGDATLPVMIWIHGGSFSQGSGRSNPIFLESLENKEMIFVGINYRLALFGFMNLPEIIDSTPDKNAGFFGIQDQRMAFQWVKDNIAVFGGDSNRVTISGQSAGAISVCTHIAAPRSAGLFQRALMESGSCNQLNSAASGTSSSRTAANALGCNSTTNVLQCLVSKSAAEILGALGNLWPSLNEYEILEQPINLIKQGKYNKVGLLAGTNHDEQSFQTCTNVLGLNAITLAQYNQSVDRVVWGTTVRAAAKRMYPGQYFNPPTNGITRLWTDFRWRYPTLDLLSAMSKYQSSSSLYMYSFDHVKSNQINPASCFGVSHSDELGFVFAGGSPPTWNSWFTPGERVMALSMREWWVNFLYTGVPQSPLSSISWTPYVDSQKNYLSIQCDVNKSMSSMQTDFMGVYYQFWQAPTEYTGPVPNPNLPSTTTTTKAATTSSTSTTTVTSSASTTTATSSASTTKAASSTATTKAATSTSTTKAATSSSSTTKAATSSASTSSASTGTTRASATSTNKAAIANDATNTDASIVNAGGATIAMSCLCSIILLLNLI